jgi:hypothetical protein
MNVKFKETDIDSKIRIYVLSMNMDPSNNSITNSGGGDEDRNRDDFYERFHVSQYYNAVEDEQTYMDEYTSLIHTYNEFIVNGNAMFSRMEQTLRDNLARSIVRQTFYYHRFNELRRERGVHVPISTNQFISNRPTTQTNIPAASAASAMPQPPAAAVASTPPAQPSLQSHIADVFPRLLSRYLNTEISRESRERINQPNNIFSMLYTIPLEFQTNGGGGGGGGGDGAARTSAPTTDQIRLATQDILFSQIISPVNAICPISRDEFNDESEITIIRGCNHIFNRTSLREWFVHHSTCPMCRSDIRDYRPPSEPTVPRRPANMSIDSIDENHMTFSYDLPLNYTNNQIYHDIVNTVNDMTSATATETLPARNQYHYNDDDYDDIPEID